jgi:hypothetical protein
MKNSKRIDPVVAMTMATGIAILNPIKESVWEREGYRPI